MKKEGNLESFLVVPGSSWVTLSGENKYSHLSAGKFFLLIVSFLLKYGYFAEVISLPIFMVTSDCLKNVELDQLKRPKNLYTWQTEQQIKKLVN